MVHKKNTKFGNIYIISKLPKMCFLLYIHWLKLCRQSDGYVSDEDSIAKFENCLRTTKFDRSCMVFYFSKLKEIYGSS